MHRAVLKQVESTGKRCWRIDDIVIDPHQRTVTRAGRELALEPRAFDVLAYLVENHGRVVSRTELLEAVWRDRVVTDDAVYRAVRLARSVFGERGNEVLKTVHGHGYRCPSSSMRDQDMDSAAAAADDGRKRISRPARYRVAALLLAVLVIAVVASVWHWPALDAAPSDRVAVLPFETSAADAERSYLGRELASELVDQLTEAHGLKAFDLGPGAGRTADDLRRLTGANHAVTGRWRLRAKDLSLHVEIHELGTGRLVWSDNLTWPWRDLARLRVALGRVVAEALSANVPQTDRSGIGRPVVDVYDRFLRARHLWRTRVPANLDRAAALLKEALELDPDFARAYEALASVYLVMPSWQAIESESRQVEAFSAAREALRLDPHLGEARAILAEEARAKGNWQDADTLFGQALESEPSNPTVLHWYAEFLLMTGRLEEANDYARRAVELDPMSPMARTVRAWAAVIDDRNEEAVEQAGRAVELGMPSSNIILAWAMVRQGDGVRASAALDDLLRPSAAMEACRLAVEGRLPEEAAVRSVLDDPRHDQMAVIYHLACLAMLDRTDSALAVIPERLPGIEFAILWAPEFSGLRQGFDFHRLRSGMPES
jgi:DNA-binding winged helix-turn-helix (wHTH) protein/Tfp pilus assembly protein PilF/TolB-like protein